MLQLLLERGQSYDDIASLLGGSASEARQRARTALTELGGRDPDSDVGLTDYLLGQADPIGRADAVRHLQSDAAALALAEELVAKLRLIAPQASLPELPSPRRRRRPAAPVVGAGEAAGVAAPGPEPKARRNPLADLSPKQARLFAGIGASALILLFAVLAIAGVFEGSEEQATETTASETADGDVVSEEITTVTLRPSNGSEASGEARFGIANETQPFMELRLAGLEAAPEDQSYVVWFLTSADRGYPLAPLVGVQAGETFNERFTIPQAALPVAVRTRFVDVALIDNEELAGEIQKALRGEDVLLEYPGESILRGRVPRLEQPPADEADLEAPEETP